ncbi:hypothetical protein STEG23_030770, partial [Scotinomys teguina]
MTVPPSRRPQGYPCGVNCPLEGKKQSRGELDGVTIRNKYQVLELKQIKVQTCGWLAYLQTLLRYYGARHTGQAQLPPFDKCRHSDTVSK